MRSCLRFFLCAAALMASLLSSCRPASEAGAAFGAVPLPARVAPDQVALVVSGRVRGGEPVSLDMTTLKAFPATSFAARDPWDGHVHDYRGVLLAPLLSRLGMDPEAEYVDIVAANEYRVPILMADLEKNGYVLSYEMDGSSPLAQDEAARRRGQLQIALDFAAHPDLSVETYKSQLVWQVIAIEVR